jgi:hypothetical protein
MEDLEKFTYHWMERNFYLLGDHIPNTTNEINLGKKNKLDIWHEYLSDCNMYKVDNCMGFDHFLQFWKTYFSNVKCKY